MSTSKRPAQGTKICAGLVDRAKRVALRPKDIIPRGCVNIQRIQNGNSEFFVNSRRKMRFVTSSVDKGKFGFGVVL